uniref:Uncharacterized protein n=1 Tax=Haptolina ericina TaxID=156174 RepID=A0A7S3B7Q3_9EUKA
MDEGRPTSGMRGRVTRRQAAPSDPSAGGAGNDGAHDDDGDDDGQGSTWKQEMDSIMNSTHPALIQGLKRHEDLKKQHIAQAERVRQLQTANINNMFECEKQQAENESAAQLEFFRSRLIDSIEEKQRKVVHQSGFRIRSPAVDGNKQPAKRRFIGGLNGLNITYSLTPEEMKSDLEEITSSVDRYSVRSAAVASDDLRNSSSSDAWFDRNRQQLHCNGNSFERGSQVLVYQQGQRVEDMWTMTAMNAVEVTLRDSDSQKLKVTLAQLRNGRFVFRPGGDR